MKKIILFGGEGYIGKVIVNQLINKHYDIISFDNLIYDQEKNQNYKLYDNYKFINGDIRNLYQISEAIRDRDIVILLAGLVGDPITKKYPKLSDEINYFGVQNVINECVKQKINKLIFISTCSNYGFIHQNFFADENFELKPLSNYAKAKVAAEEHILSFKNKIDTCMTILRFATAFGYSPRMRYDLTVNEFTKDVFLNKKLDIYDADTWRPYCHVQDFSDIIDLIINFDENKLYFEVFNVGSDDNNFTKRMIVNQISKKLSCNNVNYISKIGTDSRNYRVSFEKAINILGCRCKYTVMDGINEIIKNLSTNAKLNYKKFENLGNYNIL